MPSFSPIHLVLLSICIGLISAEDQLSVSANLMSSVVLPCKLRVISETPYIRWSSDKDVFERSGKDWFQGQGYEGRADVLEDKLLSGDCSLVLTNVTLADTGVYKSYQAVRRVKRDAVVREKWELINSVKLFVDGSIEPNKKISPETAAFADAAGVNWPHPLLMFLSLLSCFTFQIVYRET